MFWLVVLSTVSLGVGVIVFVLARDAFPASRVRREASKLSVPRGGDAKAINTLMREKLAVPPPAHPAALFSGQHDQETDALAETLAQVRENPMLPAAPKAYLRLEEREDSLEHLLRRYIPARGGVNREQPAPREFSIVVAEKSEAPQEHEKEKG